MDFIRVAYKTDKSGTREFYPALLAVESRDLVVRGGQFAAVWDETTGLYNRRISQTPAIIDRWFAKAVGEQLRPGDTIKKVKEFDNQIFSRFIALIRNIGDMGPELDQKLVYADQTPTKEMAATFKMGYSLSHSPPIAWDELCDKLYAPEERLKFEYAIGSILTGDSLYMQKAYVFFGAPGKGKSTIMDIIEALFHGHTGSFKASELGNASSQFSLEPFKLNPLVGIDQDADLSKIEINTLLNMIISHDKLQINAKGKSLFEIIPRTCLFVGTNKPVKITDSKSGLYRRIVDIHPTGEVFDEPEYRRITAAVRYELGSIAQHCINVFSGLGAAYLSSYRPTDMMARTNDIFNFVEDHRPILTEGIELQKAWKLFIQWCEESEIRNVYKQYQFRDLIADYYEEFHKQIMVGGERHRSYFSGLKNPDKFDWKKLAPSNTHWLELAEQPSQFDLIMADMPAQLSTGNDQHPLKQAWADTKTKLSDLDTSLEHFVKVPTSHIVIDIDLKDGDGNKSLEACMAEAAVWPPSYAEPSRSGSGLHIHYDYEGDVAQLDSLVRPGVEIKSLLGGGSLRRRLSLSNGLPVARISSGLPIKEAKQVLSKQTMTSELGLRKQIVKGITREVWPHTKPSMDFIKQVLDDAVAQGLEFDVTDMWDDILEFALSSNNQKNVCMEIALSLQLKSEHDVEAAPVERPGDKPIAYFDLEVYPNLFTIGYCYEEGDEVVKLLNPTPKEVERLVDNHRLIGYYNRLYDNHILYARILGYSVEQLYQLSQSIIVENNRHKLFGAAYNLAYADVYDMLAADGKRSLKKWQIDLGLPHMEMDLPWDQPVPEERVQDVLDYMDNDVLSTRAVARHRSGDVKARHILAQLSGLEVCNTNRQHTERLVFGELKETQDDLKYTHLAELFPGYEFNQFAPGKEKSTYRGVQVGEGGFVSAEPGMYRNVAVLDGASMHPSSIIAMNVFGKYTERFKALMDIRLALKAKDFEKAMAIDPALEPFITRPHEGYDLDGAKALSDALKTVINSVYGLTAASFPNKFRDDRNLDNIVAKRGALFMLDLKAFIESKGFQVVHIKTDSVKIPNATPQIIADVRKFGEQYGYSFEHEDTYERFCLVNDAVYVAYSEKHQKWEATGAQFKHPVVFKSLFSKEKIEPRDYVEVKQVAKGAMYLVNEEDTVRSFIGKFGAFVPVIEGRQLVRIDGDKVGAVTGTKGYLWEIDETALVTGKSIDMQYFQNLVDEAVRNIEKHGVYTEFVA